MSGKGRIKKCAVKRIVLHKHERNGEKIMAYLGYLGIKIDRVTNDKTRGVEALISTADSSVKVCVIPTNEELAICRETVKLVG